ncbi:TauD/TfdA dioxygenase family protein [Kordiimonas aquimaris]|uniref:TauD/TfdA dioxygenase family protein n=1 Tax=Kordiimonas aquimaris TaxID=707591 RepID=UPI0021D36AC4|nr:TauD/TfdA family dioxygenase [Kordiimonas aquimaris]
MTETNFKTLKIEKLTGAMGAMISGVNLSENISDEQFTEIRDALFTYGAIGFRNQNLSFGEHSRFAKRFGSLEVHPIVNGMDEHPEIIKMHKPAGTAASFGVGWHTDNSFFEKPSLGSILYAEIIPPVGGDTLFANQQLAYQHLSEGLKETLEGLVAIHSAQDAYTSPSALEKYDGDGPISYKKSEIVTQSVEHPVIIQHPVTGKKALYVNSMFTSHFKGWSVEESQPLIEYLCAHATRIDFQCRFRWEKGMVAMWDNRIVQHAALNDYEQYERLIYRITVNGDTLKSS